MKVKRYSVLITNQGMDAAIPLIDDPDRASDVRNSTPPEEVLEKRVIITHLFQEGTIPEKWYIKRKVEHYILKKQNETSKKLGGVNMGEYLAYELRKRFTGGGRLNIIIGLEEKWFKKFRRMNSYKAAFHLLDIMITGKTNLGRFDKNEKQETVVGFNLMKKDKKNEMKVRRREIMGHLQGSEDPDEI